MPSGAVQFQMFRFLPQPPRLFSRTTPLYVLDGKHPDINRGLFMITNCSVNEFPNFPYSRKDIIL